MLKSVKLIPFLSSSLRSEPPDTALSHPSLCGMCHRRPVPGRRPLAIQRSLYLWVGVGRGLLISVFSTRKYCPPIKATLSNISFASDKGGILVYVCFTIIFYLFLVGSELIRRRKVIFLGCSSNPIHGKSETTFIPLQVSLFMAFSPRTP